MKKYNISKAISMLLIAMFSIVFLDTAARAESITGVEYKTVQIEDVDIFYREAGDPSRPTILLLHGFPTSSHMFRELIPQLANEFHVIAPDFPGFGLSSMPSADEYDYTFANLASVTNELLERRGYTQALLEDLKLGWVGSPGKVFTELEARHGKDS